MCQEPGQTVDSPAKLLNLQMFWRLTVLLLQIQTGQPASQLTVGHVKGWG